MKLSTAGLFMTTIFSVLFISIPSYAQQVEIERFLTPEKTTWRINDTFSIPLGSDPRLGFSEGDIWLCENTNCIKFDNSHYFNWIISKFDASICIPIPIVNINVCYSIKGHVIPILRSGKLTFCVDATGECADSTLTKINDNF